MTQPQPFSPLRRRVKPAQDGHIDVQDLRRALERLPGEQCEALILVGRGRLLSRGSGGDCRLRRRYPQESCQPRATGGLAVSKKWRHVGGNVALIKPDAAIGGKHASCCVRGCSGR